MKPSIYCVDVGYGFVKSLSQKPFPSVVVEINVNEFFKGQDGVELGNPFIVGTEDGTYAVGETAISISRSPVTLMEGRNRWEGKEYKALLLSGIAKQMPSGDLTQDVFLVTGLPYLQSNNKEEVEGLKRTFTKQHRVHIMEDGKAVCKNINIVRVDVLSQPRGAYYSLVGLTQKRIKQQTALIADLGFKSLDYLLLNDGQESGESTGEDAIAGMEVIYKNMLRDLRSEGAPQIALHEMDKWIDRGYLQKYDNIIKRHFSKASKLVAQDIKEKFAPVWSRLELIGAIYFVGGSSQRLQPYLQQYFLNIPVIFAENSQQLVVDGYGAYARAVHRKNWGEVDV